ncbi:MAG TPA: hypothetical protein VFW78_11850 [Bacteroidia bacterium]|nr:hypothetical protein [Bacteroidia bacterium]
MKIATRLFISTLTYFLAISNCQGQQLILSPEINEPGFDHLKVVGQDAGGYYVLLSNLNLENPNDRVGLKNRKTKLAYFDTMLNMKWMVPVKPFPEDAEIEAIGFIKDNIVVFSSVTERSTGKVSFYSKSFNASGESIDPSSPFAIVGMEGDREKAILVSSIDKKRVALIVHSNIHVVRTATQTDYILILDQELKLVEQKKFEIPYSEKLYSAYAYALSGRGDIASLGLLSDKPKGKRQFEYLSYYSPVSDTSTHHVIVGQGKRVRGLGVEFDNIENRAIYAGFYENADAGMMAGILYAAMSMEPGSNLQLSAKPIDPKRNVKLAGRRYSRSGISLVNFPIQRLILRNNGGAVLVTEAAYTSDYSYYDYFMQSFTNRVEYHFDDIVVISIDDTGEAEWSTVVDKEQISMDDGGYFSSFCSLLNSEELIVLFNDDISRDNQVIGITIDKTGTPRQQIAAKKDARLLIVPRAGKQVSIDQILVPVNQRKSLLLARFTFE